VTPPGGPRYPARVEIRVATAPFIVEVNEPAVHLWKSLGFEVIGTVPEAFDHPDHGLVGLHVMYRRL
jgi:hypothetical protein